MKLFVANWKMNFTLHEEIEWCIKNLPELAQLPALSELVLCPSSASLIPLSNLLRTIPNNPIKLGAQTCSAHITGAYTSQLSATTLKQAGCSYVIIGHSEERTEFKLSNNYIALQVKRALEANLIPIVCIGESQEEHDSLQTRSVLEEQLEPILGINYSSASFYIAYEPLWAIGSGNKPDIEELAIIFSFIKTLTRESKLLYGGSVDEDYVKECTRINYLDGFLIGRASLNFQELKKIVSLPF